MNDFARLILAAFLVLLGVPALAACGKQAKDTVFADGFEKCDGLPAGSTVSILWVGNSLTGTPPDFKDYSLGPLPVRLAPMLAEMGISMKYQAVIQGGADFSDHAANPTTMALIGDPSFDMVNLQGYYQGFSSPEAYRAAVLPLYTAAHNAGSISLYEGMWPYLTDPGSPQHPAAALAVEGASAVMPGSFPVQVGRAWARIKETDSVLHAKLRDDNTHQSAVGEYLNCLVYTRFLSARSVKSIASISPQAQAATTAQERQELKDAVDAAVTIFYVPSGASYPSLRITAPQNGQVFHAGEVVTFAANATDTDGSSLDAAIRWTDAAGQLLHTGAGFEQTPPAGQYSVTAAVTGAGGGTVSGVRNFTVAAGPNQPPVATDKTQSVPHDSPFAQVNLKANAVDPDGSIDWSTLQLDLRDFHGKSARQDPTDPATVDVDYTNGFSGKDLIHWRVGDNLGACSNWAQIHLLVQAGARANGGAGQHAKIAHVSGDCSAGGSRP